MEKTTFLQVYHKYNISIISGYTAENVITDARLIARNFTPAKNGERALYQLAKLVGIANSLDLIITAIIHLRVDSICKHENIHDLIHLQRQVNDIICELYFHAPASFSNTHIADHLLDNRYIR